MPRLAFPRSAARFAHPAPQTAAADTPDTGSCQPSAIQTQSHLAALSAVLLPSRGEIRQPRLSRADLRRAPAASPALARESPRFLARPAAAETADTPRLPSGPPSLADSP